jgi:hypothetical protein
MQPQIGIRQALKMCDYAIETGVRIGNVTDAERLVYDNFYCIAEEAFKAINPEGSYLGLLTRVREEAKNSLNGAVPTTVSHLRLLRDAVKRKVLPNLIDDTSWWKQLGTGVITFVLGALSPKIQEVAAAALSALARWFDRFN